MCIPHETVTVIWCCISISQELVESCTTTVKGWMLVKDSDRFPSFQMPGSTVGPVASFRKFSDWR